MVSDVALAERVRGGDDAAFAELARRHDDLVGFHAQRFRSPVREHADFHQEALYGLWEAARDFRCGHGSSFRTFAGLAIEREVATALKMDTRQKHRPVSESARWEEPAGEDGSSLAELIPGPRNDEPVEILIRRERFMEILRVIAEKCSDLERAVIERYWSGVRYERIAAQLGVSEKAVDNALQRVRHKLGTSDAERSLPGMGNSAPHATNQEMDERIAALAESNETMVLDALREEPASIGTLTKRLGFERNGIPDTAPVRTAIERLADEGKVENAQQLSRERGVPTWRLVGSRPAPPEDAKRGRITAWPQRNGNGHDGALSPEDKMAVARLTGDTARRPRFQDKACSECGQMFTPRGGRTKRCDECRGTATKPTTERGRCTFARNGTRCLEPHGHVGDSRTLHRFDAALPPVTTPVQRSKLSGRETTETPSSDEGWIARTERERGEREERLIVVLRAAEAPMTSREISQITGDTPQGEANILRHWAADGTVQRIESETEKDAGGNPVLRWALAPEGASIEPAREETPPEHASEPESGSEPDDDGARDEPSTELAIRVEPEPDEPPPTLPVPAEADGLPGLAAASLAYTAILLDKLREAEGCPEALCDRIERLLAA